MSWPELEDHQCSNPNCEINIFELDEETTWNYLTFVERPTENLCQNGKRCKYVERSFGHPCLDQNRTYAYTNCHECGLVTHIECMRCKERDTHKHWVCSNPGCRLLDALKEQSNV